MYNKLWHDMLNELENEIKKLKDSNSPHCNFQASTLISFLSIVKSMETKAINESLIEAGYLNVSNSPR